MEAFVETTRLFGRAKELAELSRLVEHGARLVTVIGAAGIGKTRLATRFALQHAGSSQRAGGVLAIGPSATHRHALQGQDARVLLRQRRARASRLPAGGRRGRA